MAWVHRTLIVPVSQVTLAREICQKVPPGKSGWDMFTVGLSATGSLPATHYISSGLIQDDFAYLLGKSLETTNAAVAKGVVTNQTAVAAMYTASTIVEGTRQKTVSAPGGGTMQVVVGTDPHEVIADLGLKLIQGSI